MLEIFLNKRLLTGRLVRAHIVSSNNACIKYTHTCNIIDFFYLQKCDISRILTTSIIKVEGWLELSKN